MASDSENVITCSGVLQAKVGRKSGLKRLERRIKKLWRARRMFGAAASHEEEEPLIFRDDDEEKYVPANYGCGSNSVQQQREQHYEPKRKSNKKLEKKSMQPSSKDLSSDPQTTKDTTAASKKNKKKKRILRRLGKTVLTTCRYIGLGAQMTAMPPHGMHSYNLYYATNRAGGYGYGGYYCEQPPNDIYYSYSTNYYYP